jgi:hypothetical protein
VIGHHGAGVHQSLWSRNEVSGCQCPDRRNTRPSGETTGRWHVQFVRVLEPSTCHCCGQPGASPPTAWRPYTVRSMSA